MGRLLFALSGPTVWFLFFSALYAIETMACTPAIGLQGTLYGRAAGGAVIAAGLLLAAIAASQFVAFRRDRRSIDGIGLLLTALSVMATAWAALPVWMMQSCG